MTLSIGALLSDFGLEMLCIFVNVEWSISKASRAANIVDAGNGRGKIARKEKEERRARQRCKERLRERERERGGEKKGGERRKKQSRQIEKGERVKMVKARCREEGATGEGARKRKIAVEIVKDSIKRRITSLIYGHGRRKSSYSFQKVFFCVISVLVYCTL